MSNKIRTVILTSLIFLLPILGLLSVWKPLLQEKRLSLEKAQLRLTTYEQWAKQASEWKILWNEYVNFQVFQTDKQQRLNVWMKDIMNQAERWQVKLEKMLPSIREFKNNEQIRIQFEYDGKIENFIRFIYFMDEKYPLAHLDKFSLEKAAESETMKFEMQFSQGVIA